jgi:fatty acid desaturase
VALFEAALATRARQRCTLRHMFGLVTRVKAVRRRTQTLFELNLELAKLEAKKKAVAAGIAGGLAAVGAVLVVYGIGFLFAAVAAGLSEALPLWLSLLIVALVLFLLAAVAVFFAKRSASKATPPQPAQAIDEATRTVNAVKSHV